VGTVLVPRRENGRACTEARTMSGTHARRHQHQHREWKVQVGAPRPARTVNVSRACASTTQRAINNLSQRRRPPVHAAARSEPLTHKIWRFRCCCLRACQLVIIDPHSPRIILNKTMVCRRRLLLHLATTGCMQEPPSRPGSFACGQQ